jgi:hypothetical protein
MNRLFILGAGFSKAFSGRMPLLSELSDSVRRDDGTQRPRLPRDAFRNDFEALLTYLFQQMPWKSPEDIHGDLAEFYALSRLIAARIGECEEEAFNGSVPQWATRYAQYLAQTQTTVVTLNYDTILERLLTQCDMPAGNGKINERGLYSLPLVHIGFRSGNYDLTIHQGASWLLKIHGSINWFVAPDAWDSGGQVFFSKISERGTSNEAFGKRDLIPLLIPPVADKSSFYRSGLVRTMWEEISQAFADAEEVFCIGYSLPKTDLTMRLFFMGATPRPDQRIYVVNNSSSEALVREYEEVFFPSAIDRRFLGSDHAVEEMVDYVVSTNTQDKTRPTI